MTASNAMVFRAKHAEKFLFSFEWVLVGLTLLAFANFTLGSWRLRGPLAFAAGVAGLFVTPLITRLFLWPPFKNRYERMLGVIRPGELYAVCVGEGPFGKGRIEVRPGSELEEEGAGHFPCPIHWIEPLNRSNADHARALEEATETDIGGLAEALRESDSLTLRLAAFGLPDPAAVARATKAYRNEAD